MIIDGESVKNFVSTGIVDKLNLQVEKKANPYRLAWTHDRDRFIVREQCRVPFIVGKLKKSDVATLFHDNHTCFWDDHNCSIAVSSMSRGRTHLLKKDDREFLLLPQKVVNNNTPETLRLIQKLSMHVSSPAQWLLGPYPRWIEEQLTQAQILNS